MAELWVLDQTGHKLCFLVEKIEKKI
jgi:hypothetical protein